MSRFIPRLLLAALAAVWLVPLVGCGGNQRETGATVEMTPEDIQGFEAAEASYEAMEKGNP